LKRFQKDSFEFEIENEEFKSLNLVTVELLEDKRNNYSFIRHYSKTEEQENSEEISNPTIEVIEEEKIDSLEKEKKNKKIETENETNVIDQQNTSEQPKIEEKTMNKQPNIEIDPKLPPCRSCQGDLYVLDQNFHACTKCGNKYRISSQRESTAVIDESNLPPCKVCRGLVTIFDENAYICNQCGKKYRRNIVLEVLHSDNPFQLPQCKTCELSVVVFDETTYICYFCDKKYKQPENNRFSSQKTNIHFAFSDNSDSVVCTSCKYPLSAFGDNTYQCFNCYKTFNFGTIGKDRKLIPNCKV
jgi:hydrogenase maturation factor HypF (carbamoyltransferase family)